VATTGFAPGEREPFEDLRRSGKENAYLLRCHFVVTNTDHFTKTGSGQTQGKLQKRAACPKIGVVLVTAFPTGCEVHTLELWRYFLLRLKPFILPRQARDELET
jgi:hypothetical protein